MASNQSDPELSDESFFRTKGRILTRNPYLVQASVGYNITELITGDLFAIWDPEGGRVLYGPQFSFNASNEIIIVAGARLYSLGSAPRGSRVSGGSSPGISLHAVAFLAGIDVSQKSKKRNTGPQRESGGSMILRSREGPRR